jgi:hypothetical protein
MVYFEQHVVLPPETRDRLDRLLDLLSAYHHKLPAFSSLIDPDAAVNALKSIDHTIANFEPILRRIDVFNSYMRGLLIVGLFLIVWAVVLSVFGLSVGYMVWSSRGYERVWCEVSV